MDSSVRATLDQILGQLILADRASHPAFSKKVLFSGEEMGKVASYVAGWMAGQGGDVIVLDGANRFDPYTVSSFARKALIPPERLLKRIRIARAFTCYQMTTLMGKLISLVGAIHESPLQKPRVIVLGPITTFLDQDVPEREVRPLFERSLRKLEGVAAEGIPFFLFQSPTFSGNPPFSKGGVGGLMNPKREYLSKRLVQFSDLVWRIEFNGQGVRVVPEKIPKNFFCHPSEPCPELVSRVGSGSPISGIHPIF
ncbi:MAG: hypothetical protein QME90_10355 [Thermodesulfobacteriota bacterium]|nr:hypothetical protein [Thermodesulfobacteriota bacterium]